MDQTARFVLLRRQALLCQSALFILVFLVTAQLAIGSIPRALRADAPEAVIEITKRDFGEVFAGEELECAFIVRNAGTKALELAEKSTIPARSVGSSRAPSTAVWRTEDRLFTRAVALTRAAPS